MARSRYVWYCDGERPNGLRCNQVLGVFEEPPVGEIKCRRCGHFGKRTRSFPWNLDDPHNRETNAAPAARDATKEQPRAHEVGHPHGPR